MKISWTPKSQNDLQDMYDYISQDNPVAAKNLVLTIKKKVELLAKFPFAGREGRVPNTRELVISGTNYFVAYRVLKNKDIDILAVIHQARDYGETLH